MLKGQVNEFGYQSMTSPMTLQAFDTALQRHGTMSLDQVLQPAIDYCMNGFAVRPRVLGFLLQPAQAGRIERVAVVNKLDAARKIYLNEDGALLNVGDILKNRIWADFTNGSRGRHWYFYDGDIADLIAADMEANGGLLTGMIWSIVHQPICAR